MPDPHDQADPPADHGRCGAATNSVLPGGHVSVCALPVQHQGWHRSDEGTEWGQPTFAVAVAPAARTADDRVIYNEPGEWLGPDYAVGLVDEIVVSDATAHFEMTTDNSGYLNVWSPRREVFLRFRARPTTRQERRQILVHSGDRLRDHLHSVLPVLHRRKLRTIWFVPWWNRPTAAVRDWWDAWRGARAVLCVEVEIDQHCGGPEAGR